MKQETKVTICVVLASLLLPTGAWALDKASSGNPPGLAEIQELSAKRKDFSVSFQQSTFSALRNKTTTQKGTLDFKPPRSFRWEVALPKKELYLSDGTEFWKYSEAAKHAQRLAANVADLRFLDVLLRPGSLSDDYNVRPWVKTKGSDTPDAITENPPAPQDGKIYISLFPKGKSKQKAMYAIVDGKRGFVDELRLFYENGNKSRIVFGSLAEKAVAPERFRFTPPAGTAIDK